MRYIQRLNKDVNKCNEIYTKAKPRILIPRGGGSSICWGTRIVPPVRLYFLRPYVLSGYTFLPIFLVCVFSGMRFNLIVRYVFPQGKQFRIVFYVLAGSWSGSSGGTTPSISCYLLPPPPPHTHTPRDFYTIILTINNVTK